VARPCGGASGLDFQWRLTPEGQVNRLGFMDSVIRSNMVSVGGVATLCLVAIKALDIHDILL
jgi:hypothetical protein